MDLSLATADSMTTACCEICGTGRVLSCPIAITVPSSNSKIKVECFTAAVYAQSQQVSRLLSKSGDYTHNPVRYTQGPALFCCLIGARGSKHPKAGRLSPSFFRPPPDTDRSTQKLGTPP